ncbi:hypothetical protein B0H11DRAFT_2252225 [Mycena galericulata]|nr:hypothetical protein B0H11DRAFT_2252225 [Mycena galericulata]
MTVCDIPFHPNPANYINKTEHDSNDRKLWFLILDCGLFTRRSDANLMTHPDNVLFFPKREQAEECWAQHCSAYHDQTDAAHQDDPPEPPAAEHSSLAPVSLRIDAPRQRRSQDDGAQSAASTLAPAPGSARARSRTKTPASREAQRKRTSPPLPLYRDDDEPSPPRRHYTLTAAPAPSPACPAAAPAPSPSRPAAAPAPSPARPAAYAESSPVYMGDSDSSVGEPEDFAVGWGPAPVSRVVSPRAAPARSPAPAPVLARAPAPPRFSPAHAKTPAVEEAPRKRKSTPLALFLDDDNAPTPPPQRSDNAGKKQRSHDAGMKGAKPQKRAPTVPKARAHTTAPASPPPTAASALASPKRAFSAAPHPAHPASPPPVYTVESESGSEPSSPARMAPTPAARDPGISPSVSSVSSLSSTGASWSASSVSRAGLASPRVGAASVSSASRTYASSASHAGASSASRAGAPAVLGPPAGSSGGAGPVVLYNTSSRKLYIDPALAVREMTAKETVEVVDYEDVGEFLSARAGSKVGPRT